MACWEIYGKGSWGDMFVSFPIMKRNLYALILYRNGMIALKGVTFTVDAGQKLSIIGRTGR